MVEWNVDGAITIFDVEDHGIAAALMPAANEFHAASAACGGAGEIDCADFTVLRKWPALFHNRLRFDSGNQHPVILAKRGLAIIRFADGRLKLCRRHERRLREMKTRNCQ